MIHGYKLGAYSVTNVWYIGRQSCVKKHSHFTINVTVFEIKKMAAYETVLLLLKRITHICMLQERLIFVYVRLLPSRCNFYRFSCIIHKQLYGFFLFTSIPQRKKTRHCVYFIWEKNCLPNKALLFNQRKSSLKDTKTTSLKWPYGRFSTALNLLNDTYSSCKALSEARSYYAKCFAGFLQM